MFNQIPNEKRMQEIENNHNRDAIQIGEIVKCPICGNEKTRCTMMNDEKTRMMMECPNCKNAWVHKRV
jgi:DNA-directed RNA polymerase subunit M/transcription elongation factor TFIIS